MVQSIDSRLNHQIGQARQTLIDTVMDPEIIAGIEQLRQDSQALADKIREIEPIREIARQKVESARRRVERLETLLKEDCHSRSDRETELGQLRKSLSYFGAELQRMTGEIETLQNQQAVIGQKISLLQQRSLEP
jgi:chromosome segregation ATPase